MGDSCLLIASMLSRGIIPDAFTTDLYMLIMSAYLSAVVLPFWVARRRLGLAR
jgi:hypothetical protein